MVPEIWCTTDQHTDGRMDGKSDIEVSAPPKNNSKMSEMQAAGKNEMSAMDNLIITNTIR